ncbi:hypothetical protein ACU610_02735 [Geodermatophilus sp. URMC 61]|uniref:hypothetical protein n=1 Tax=Geodermatophilus sp. URMC 61 TaxID=3423411 RepID=UPI00406D3A1A
MTTHRSGPTDAGRVTAELRELLDLCTRGATANDRQDLVERLAGARRVLETPDPAGHSVRDAAAVVLRACDSLEVDLRALRAHLQDPARVPRLQAELADARARRETFESRVQTWPAVLGEGFAALGSDLEFEVRRATRAVQAEADAALVSTDPGRHATELESWLRGRLVAEAERILGRLHEDTRAVAARLADQVGLAALDVPTSSVLPAGRLVADLRPHTPPVGGGQPLATRVLRVAMPGYAGIMMTFVLSRLGGLQLPGWVMAVAAVLGALVTGGAALLGDRRRQLERRRSEGRAMVRGFLDDYQLVLGKQVRDALRVLQSDLRTTTSAAVGTHLRQLSERLDAAASAAKGARRMADEVADVEAGLGSIATLRDRARALLDPSAEGAPARRLVPVA